MRFWTRRIGGALLLIFTVSVLTFSAMNLLGDPLFNILGPVAGDTENPESLEKIALAEEQFNLNDPLPIRYVKWAGDFITGDFGPQFGSTGQPPVSDLIKERLPRSVGLLIMAQTFATVIAVPWAIFAASRANKPVDKTSTVLSFGLIAMPVFALGVVLKYLLSIRYDLFPATFTATGAQDGQVYLEITDTGIGMSQPFLHEVFNAFQQESVGESRDYEGIGLGLTLAKRLLNLHGGSIKATSYKGRGSCFTCFLPQHQTQTTLDVPSTPSVRSKQMPNVLIVDDDKDTLLLLETILHTTYKVQVASSAETALQKAHHHRFDLLVLDIKLKDSMSGLDLLQQIRQQPHHSTVRSIAITVYTQPQDRDFYLKGGFDHFLPKPFTTEQLLQSIDRTLHQAIRSTG